MLGIGIGLIAILLIAILAFALSKGGNRKKFSGTGTDNQTTQPVSPGNNNDFSAGTVSDDPSDFQFMLDGKVYTLPFSFSVLKDDGWVVDQDGYRQEDDPVGGNDLTFVRLLKI